ncbi:MAG TPA: hypothetical protein VGN96_10420 [Roseococcus sp.]|jgi:hypothetical protein|nr:hypothetical protein [Roseococcus sp.]
MLRPDPATLRAVEAAARIRCCSAYWCRNECEGTPCTAFDAFGRRVVEELAAYHAALGETARVTRVERCANMDGKEEG